MKKVYIEPMITLFVADMKNAFCQATGNYDDGSIGNEGEENMGAREFEDNSSYSIYPMWEE